MDPTDRDPDPANGDDRAEDTRLVEAVRAGDPEAYGQLYDRWYDRVFALARRITRDDDAAADVVQDTFLSAWTRLDGLRDADAFGGWLLRIARNRALDGTRTGGREQLEAVDVVSDRADDAGDRLASLDDPEAMAADGELRTLVAEAAEALGERDATALDLHLRYGLEPAEIGEVLDLNRNAANQLLHRVRDRLGTAVGSRVLWADGRPACADLRRELARRGCEEFDGQAVKVTDRHASDCAECTERRHTRLDPSVLFRSVPFVVAPVGFKAKAAAALAAEGVPMGGSEFAARDPGSGDDGDPSAEGGTRARRVRKVVTALAAAAVVAIVALVVGSASLDDDPVLRSEARSTVGSGVEASTSTSNAPSTTRPTTSAPTTTVAPSVAPEATDPVPPAPPEVVDPVPPPPPPPPPPAPPSGSVAVSPAAAPSVYTMSAAPTVSWSSSGATSVTVSGPGLSSSTASGTQAVCPGTLGTGSVCQASPGTYTYTLTLTNVGGTETRTATLTIS